MYLISCPHCSSSIPVSPSQAGDDIRCGHCGENVPIPKLGVLRQLPRATDDSAEPSGATKPAKTTGGTSFGFVATALVATASLLVAGFCTVRWALVDVPMNTTAHIAEYEEAYQTASPAALIREFQEMEERGIELPVPYKYKRLELTKQTWGRNALVAGAIALVSSIAAAVLSMSRREPA